MSIIDVSQNKTRDIYARASRVMGREGESYMTEEIQVESCRQKLKQRGLQEGIVIFEEDVSGGKRVRDRRLEELVQRCESGESGGIISYNVKRFARSVSEGSAAIERITEVGGEYLDASGNSTTDNSLAIDIYLAIGADELRKLTEQWVSVRVRVIKAGHWPGGKPPLGYIHPHRRSKLVIDPVLAPVIVELFELRLEGWTIKRLWFYLNERLAELGYSPYLAAKGVHKILVNKAYLGEIHVKGYEPNLKAHDAIVPRILFNKVQTMVKPRPGRNGKSDRLLSRLGVLVCGKCGSRMSVTHGKGGGKRQHDPTAPWLPMYRCSEYKCERGMVVQAEAVDRKVWEWVVKHNASGKASVTDKARQVADQIADLQDEYNAFMARDPKTKKALFNPKQPADVKLKQEMEAEIEELEALAARLGNGKKVVRIPANGVLTMDEKRQLVKTSIDRAIVHPVDTHGLGADRVEIIGFN